MYGTIGTIGIGDIFGKGGTGGTMGLMFMFQGKPDWKVDCESAIDAMDPRRLPLLSRRSRIETSGAEDWGVEYIDGGLEDPRTLPLLEPGATTLEGRELLGEDSLRVLDEGIVGSDPSRLGVGALVSYNGRVYLSCVALPRLTLSSLSLSLPSHVMVGSLSDRGMFPNRVLSRLLLAAANSSAYSFFFLSSSIALFSFSHAALSCSHLFLSASCRLLSSSNFRRSSSWALRCFSASRKRFFCSRFC